MRLEIEQNVYEWVVLKLGPNFVFRPHQFETIVDIIYDILNSPETNIVINAPTGSGKSLINMISAGVLFDYYKKTSFILCSDLYLFGQYEKFIIEHTNLNFGYLKGQTGNYNCFMNGKDIRCSECQMVGQTWTNLINSVDTNKFDKVGNFIFKCAKKCKYIKDRKRAMRAGVTVMTYQLFLFMLNVVPRIYKDSHGQPLKPFKERNIIFMDECHNIPSIVQNNCSPVINQQTFTQVLDLYIAANNILDNTHPIFSKYTSYDYLLSQLEHYYRKMLASEDKHELMENIDSYYSIIEDWHEVAQEIISILQEKNRQSKVIAKENTESYGKAVNILNMLCVLGDFCSAVYQCGEEYLVKEITENEETGETSLVLHCSKEDFMCYNWLLKYSPHRIYTSATTGGHEAFDENTGIKYTNVPSKMVNVPSTFDFSKSPVYIFKGFPMSYDKKRESLPMIAKFIQLLTQQYHQHERGLIQTGSYEIAESIYHLLPPEIQKRILIYIDSKDKEYNIELYKNTHDAILMGPTVNEGIDLPGDLCRFIMVAKIPYQSLASELVKAKYNLFPEWYKSDATVKLIQGIGRGVRYDGDWCKTYILDGCFLNLYNETTEQFSEELQKRFFIMKRK